MENTTPKKSAIQRIITGLIIGFTALFLLIAGGLPLLMLITVVVIIGSIEYVKILQHKGFYPSLKVILVVNTIFAIIAYFNCSRLMPVALTAGLTIAFMWVFF